MRDHIHVTPMDDLIEHEVSHDCVCGPSCTLIPGGVLITHHSLDGREGKEVCPQCKRQGEHVFGCPVMDRY